MAFKIVVSVGHVYPLAPWLFSNKENRSRFDSA